MHTMRAVLLYLAASLLSVGVPQEPPRPAVDHHQHLFSPAVGPVASGLATTAADLIAQLDQTGIRRAAVFSVAYQFGDPNRPAVEDEYARVKAENDRVAREVAQYPDRLRGFCGLNPLKDYAVAEIARCAIACRSSCRGSGRSGSIAFSMDPTDRRRPPGPRVRSCR
jgi:hypothetical protein